MQSKDEMDAGAVVPPAGDGVTHVAGAPARATAKRTKGKHKGYSLTKRPGGKWWLRIRRNKFKEDYSEVLDPGLSPTEARDYAIEKVQELKDLQKKPDKEFLKITLKDLLERALLDTVHLKLNANDKMNIQAFLKHEKALCNKPLNNIEMMDIQRHVTRRLQAGEVKPFTITRMLVPIKRVYKNAKRTDLYGLLPNFAGSVPNPFNDRDLQLPADSSGRKRVLPYGEDEKIYEAINAHCRTYLMRRRMLMIVRLALSTALRRGVLLKLKWQDIDFENKVIIIRPWYFTKFKPAPEMVPISSKMDAELLSFFDCIPHQEKKPSSLLFPSKQDRDKMHGIPVDKTLSYKTRSARWCDDTWYRAIRLTELKQPYMDEYGKPILDDGKEIEDWFHFHDLRHTAITRYAGKPYSLPTPEYHFLQGKGEKYNHPDSISMCNDIREKIDRGDAIIEKQLKHRLVSIEASWGSISLGGQTSAELEAVIKAAVKEDTPEPVRPQIKTRRKRNG